MIETGDILPELKITPFLNGTNIVIIRKKRANALFCPVNTELFHRPENIENEPTARVFFPGIQIIQFEFRCRFLFFRRQFTFWHFPHPHAS